MTSMPRLSETLRNERHPCRCQGCGAEGSTQLQNAFDRGGPLMVWQEHDESDQPEPIVLLLCLACSNRLIAPHPRLYRMLAINEPMPGAMPICIECQYRDGVRCGHKDLRANGGRGLELRFSQPTTVHVDSVDGQGRRCGAWTKVYPSPVTVCSGREVLQ